MARATGPRTLVWVTPSAGLLAIKYGFNTNMGTDEQAILGQTLVVRGTLLTGLVIGANNIKPSRAVKVVTANSNSSFIDHEAVTAAKAAGWKITPGKNTQRRSSARTVACYATINGVKVGHQLIELTGETKLATLGLVAVTANDYDIFYGCSVPKAPKAKTTYTNGTSASSVYDPSVTLPTTFASVRSAVLFPS